MNQGQKGTTVQMKLQLPQSLVWAAGKLLHSECYVIEMSRIRECACVLTVKETPKMPADLVELFKRAAAPGAVAIPELWLRVCASSQVPNMGIVIQELTVIETKWAPADAAEVVTPGTNETNSESASAPQEGDQT